MAIIDKISDFAAKMKDKRLYCLITYLTRYKEIKANNNRLLSEYYIKWLIDKEKKVIFFNNPKVACTSLMVSMFKCTDVPDKDSLVQVHMYYSENRITDLPSDIDNYFKFGFVRNPFARLVSFYENRFENNVLKDFKMKSNLDGYLNRVESFEDLVLKISKIPDFMLDPHFSMQYPIFYSNGKCLVDFIGKFENLENDYKDIQQKYDFLPIPHYNKSAKTKSWQDYYTIKSANAAYKKYKKDFKAFGYEDEYKKLLDYIKSKS